MATLKTRIILRNDTANNWVLNNPILAAGEFGVENDTGLFKVGNGLAAWNNLPYANQPGTTVFGDNESIEINEENGVLSLKNWKTEYYKWDSENKAYVKTEGWAAFLQPRLDENGTLAWYEPSDITVEDVNTTVTNLQTSVTNINNILGTPTEETVYDALGRLEEAQKDFLPLEGGTLKGDLYLSDGGLALSNIAAQILIDNAVASAGHLKREIVEELPPVEEANAETIYMVKKDSTVLEGDIYTEWMLIDGVFAQIGDTSVDLSNYIQKIAAALMGNLPAFDDDGALTDSGIAAQAIKDHLDNDKIHITEEERNHWNDSIKALFATMETKKFEISNVPANTKIKYSDEEIRVMVPENTEWISQQVGANGNPNMYYMAFKAYAPENAVSFKEGDRGVIDDEMFYFENNDFAGIDAYGRKYSIVWLALANNADGVWTYFGKNSSTSHYVGWSYVVEWYDADGNIINNDGVRINLSNESCHDSLLPYYMGDVVKEVEVNGALVATINNKVSISTSDLIKESDEISVGANNELTIKRISVSKLYSADDEELVLNGGDSDV